MFMVPVCAEFEFKYNKIVCHANCASAASNTSAGISSLTITSGVPDTQPKESRLAAGEAFLCDLVPAQRRICNSDRSEPFEVKMALEKLFLVLTKKTVVKRAIMEPDRVPRLNSFMEAGT
jgi:hypothetical protein